MSGEGMILLGAAVLGNLRILYSLYSYNSMVMAWTDSTCSDSDIPSFKAAGVPHKDGILHSSPTLRVPGIPPGLYNR